MLARIRSAFVNVDFAMETFESRVVTEALIGIDAVDTKATVQTRLRLEWNRSNSILEQVGV